MCNEFIPRGYDCLDNTDKLLASLLAERIGLSLRLFDGKQISVFIHAGKHSCFFYVCLCDSCTANRVLFARDHYPVSHLEK